MCAYDRQYEEYLFSSSTYNCFCAPEVCIMGLYMPVLLPASFLSRHRRRLFFPIVPQLWETAVAQSDLFLWPIWTAGVVICSFTDGQVYNSYNIE